MTTLSGIRPVETGHFGARGHPDRETSEVIEVGSIFGNVCPRALNGENRAEVPCRISDENGGQYEQRSTNGAVKGRVLTLTERALWGTRALFLPNSYMRKKHYRKLGKNGALTPLSALNRSGGAKGAGAALVLEGPKRHIGVLSHDLSLVDRNYDGGGESGLESILERLRAIVGVKGSPLSDYGHAGGDSGPVGVKTSLVDTKYGERGEDGLEPILERLRATVERREEPPSDYGTSKNNRDVLSGLISMVDRNYHERVESGLESILVRLRAFWRWCGVEK